jgi:DNA-binding beta-propeller fold protein YncE
VISTAARRVLPLTLALALLAGCTQPKAELVDPFIPPSPQHIAGRYVAVICDADMGATAFADGILARPRPEAVDTLTVVGLPISPDPGPGVITWKTPFAQVPVSNSVIGPPTALAVSPNGNAAFVVESRKAAAPGSTTMNDLAPGQLITPIDLADPFAPKVLPGIDIGVKPTAVDVHPDGDLVAVVTATPGRKLVIARCNGAKIDPDGILAWDLIGSPELAKANPVSVAWHPSGRYLAVTVASRNEVVFYEVSRQGGAGGLLGIAPWGDPVKVGKHPFMGRFTPDGRHFISSNLHWGDDVDGYLVGAPAGTLSVIRLSDVPSAVPTGTASTPVVTHAVVNTATVGISPEGLAISPDGRFVATANLRRSMLPASDPRMQAGSVTLLGFDAASGTLTVHDEATINAMPEGLAFDAAGRHIIVTQFRSFDPQAVDGELAFFRVNPAAGTAAPSLTAGTFYVGVGVGPHGVVIVR